MHVLGTVGCQQVHGSKIWYLVLSVMIVDKEYDNGKKDVLGNKWFFQFSTFCLILSKISAMQKMQKKNSIKFVKKINVLLFESQPKTQFCHKLIMNPFVRNLEKRWTIKCPHFQTGFNLSQTKPYQTFINRSFRLRSSETWFV